MRIRARSWTVPFVVAVACLSLVASGCSSGDDETATKQPAATGSDAGENQGGGSDDPQMSRLIEAATEEGSVTIYSSQGLDQLNALASAFEDEYPGIKVEVVRGTDADAIPRVDTELETNTPGADLAVMTVESWLTENAKQGNFIDPTASPQLGGLGDYDADEYLHDGNYFEVGAAVLTFAWNTELLPDGLEDYDDLLDPQLANGKIGIVDPAISPSIVDFYLWLGDTFGEDYVEDLAALQPRIYPSALPIGEALTSGEIYATTYGAPVQLVPAKDKGAPVDFGISAEGAWGARYYGAIPKSAAHPNAAILLADFMVRPLGQELVQGASGSVLPDIPGTLITNDRIRKQDLEATAPEPAAEYVEMWNGLFR